MKMKDNTKIWILLLVVFGMALVFLQKGYQDAVKTDLTDTFAPMSTAHYFGTDHLGRDIYSLMVDGAGRTMMTILIASFLSLCTGVFIGTWGAYFGGTIETVLQFAVDILMIIPSFILALIISAVMGLNPLTAGITLGISGIGDYANQAMILTKQVKMRTFIFNEKAMGIPSFQIISRHIIPNILPPILAALGNRASSIAIQYASLSFIGLGADLTKPDWGALLYQYRVYIIDKPMLLFWPGISIFVLAFTFHLIFDAREE